MRIASLDVLANGQPAPGELHRLGPIVDVVLRGPTGEAVSGKGIIDTGATMTCFDEDAAKHAKMPVIRTATMGSATHANVVVPVFAGQVEIAGFANFNPVAGAFGAQLGDDIVALIGRDILSLTLMIYNGLQGKITLCI